METGSKYNRDLDVKDIAKLVRKDIAAAIKSGKLPSGMKCSVRIDRFSGGCSMDVDIKAMPESFRIWTREFVRFDVENKGMAYYEGQRYTEAAKAVLETVEAIVDSYNRKDIDYVTDYFNVRFYGSVQYSFSATNPDRARAEAEVSKAA